MSSLSQTATVLISVRSTSPLPARLYLLSCPQANLVKMVRVGVQPVPVTLAIGDGANDVPMLQQAQVWLHKSEHTCNQATKFRLSHPLEKTRCT